MANYLNFTKATFNPYNPKVLNEGQFSWMTYDTDKQIGSDKQNTIDVYMYDNEGNQWYEKGYEGYGEFGNMDYYELLAKMNGFTEEDLEDKALLKSIRAMGKAEMRDIGIALAFDPKGKKIKTRAKGGKVLFPALVEDPKFNWKRHDFSEEAESDPNQSWYQEPEYDDYEDDDDYEQGWYENIQPTHEGVMSDIHQMIGNHKSFDTFQKEFFKEYGHKKVMKKTPEFLEWLEALYNDSQFAVAEETEIEEVTEARFVKDFDKDVLDAEYKADITTHYPSAQFFVGKMTHFFGELEPNLYFKAYYKDFVNKNGGKIKGDFKIVTIYSEKGSKYVNLFHRDVNESADVITEGRSINKISKELEKTVLSMKNTVDEWKESEGDRKSELLEKLRELNKEKANLEKELNDAVAGKDHDLQLALTEAEELAYLELDVNNILND
ncbi:hypothetical protein N9F93_00100 [bacterium]|nr:hypothetical protein [bacterium]